MVSKFVEGLLVFVFNRELLKIVKHVQKCRNVTNPFNLTTGESLAELYHGAAIANLFNSWKLTYLVAALVYFILDKTIFCQTMRLNFWC